MRCDKTAAAMTQVEPAAPIQSTDATAITMEPNTAPSANPAYMKDAFNDKPTGAWLAPTTEMRRCCCAGKKPHALKPHKMSRGATPERGVGLRARARIVKPANAPAIRGNVIA